MRGGEFEVNDHVWVLNSQRKIRISPKLTPKYVGPKYVVVENMQNLNYKIRRIDGKKKILVHRNRLKRWLMRQDNIVIAQPVKKDMMSQTEELGQKIYVQQNESVAYLLEETVKECPGETEEDQSGSKLTKKKRD